MNDQTFNVCAIDFSDRFNFMWCTVQFVNNKKSEVHIYKYKQII